ncbi:ATP-binding cassette domain-containing protein [bacterium]|nr:ATP-binding cassette domain-containing protein [bacterium]
MVSRQGAEELRLVRPGEQSNQSVPAINDPRSLAIEVTEASIHYPLGAFARGSLKENLFRLLGHRSNIQRPAYVDALRHISFSISHGERVALVGRNGSGKSSLLRALGGIYPLRSGTIRVVGQIGTLLDIALGFESEATGRENIYYRAMAMGYSRRRIREVEQAIIDFAELGDFIDLPVRTYSAGMYVRLGFAISTQFAPDILLIDEVFGAGDADFAKKALARMEGIVARAGIMVIATHDLALVQRACTRVIWLDRGEIVRDGHPEIVVPQVLNAIQSEA